MERVGFRLQAGLERAALGLARRGYPRAARAVFGAEGPLRGTLGKLPGVGPVFRFAAGGISLADVKKLQKNAQIENLPVEALTPEVIKTLTAEEVKRITPEKIGRMTVEQAVAFPDVGVLDAKQLEAYARLVEKETLGKKLMSVIVHSFEFKKIDRELALRFLSKLAEVDYKDYVWSLDFLERQLGQPK
ncbi:MAG: hypothetical protein JW873_04835 [Candidatus Saganbacteria bacterium]|nr:hypothetical protein [Candidatus Saganbacteria bacterium]